MKFIFRLCCIFPLLVISLTGFAYCIDSIPTTYDSCFQKIHQLLRSNGSFKEAVFITEEAFSDTIMEEQDFFNSINAIALIVQRNKRRYRLRHYNESDGENYLLNKAIAFTLFDTLTINIGKMKGSTTLFSYNFEDPLGKTNWSSMFVSTLLVTHKGNCRSLSYMYKILADEVGAKCWLALAPNHIYVRNYSLQIGCVSSPKVRPMKLELTRN